MYAPEYHPFLWSLIPYIDEVRDVMNLLSLLLSSLTTKTTTTTIALQPLDGKGESRILDEIEEGQRYASRSFLSTTASRGGGGWGGGGGWVIVLALVVSATRF